MNRYCDFCGGEGATILCESCEADANDAFFHDGCLEQHATATHNVTPPPPAPRKSPRKPNNPVGGWRTAGQKMCRTGGCPNKLPPNNRSGVCAECYRKLQDASAEHRMSRRAEYTLTPEGQAAHKAARERHRQVRREALAAKAKEIRSGIGMNPPLPNPVPADYAQILDVEGVPKECLLIVDGIAFVAAVADGREASKAVETLTKKLTAMRDELARWRQYGRDMEAHLLDTPTMPGWW